VHEQLHSIWFSPNVIITIYNWTKLLYIFVYVLHDVHLAVGVASWRPTFRFRRFRSHQWRYRVASLSLESGDVSFKQTRKSCDWSTIWYCLGTASNCNLTATAKILVLQNEDVCWFIASPAWLLMRASSVCECETLLASQDNSANSVINT